MGRAHPRWALAALLAMALPACSIKKIAVNSLGNALAKGGSTYAREDDPELAKQATPFGLKTIEALLEESPRHRGLLYAAASGFTQYSFAFVHQEADFVESQDLARATAERNRAKKLYRRAREYGFRGLEAAVPGFRKSLRPDTSGTLAKLRKKHVPLLYWTALAWAGAMALSKEDSSLTADQDLVEAMMKRALALDELYEHGSIYDFLISYDGGRPASAGGSVERARQHLGRARALSRGTRAWPMVIFAENVSVGGQHRKEFEALLQEALAVDVDRAPDLRLTNLLAQKRARWLLNRAEELFIE